MNPFIKAMSECQCKHGVLILKQCSECDWSEEADGIVRALAGFDLRVANMHEMDALIERARRYLTREDV